MKESSDDKDYGNNGLKSQKIGFTKTGFSKAGFAACSHYNYCHMAKRNCFYEESDPEVQKYCFCFRRNHSNDEKLEQINMIDIENKRSNQ